MKNIVLISLLTFLGGCTVSANNHHFELQEYSSKSYDDFYNTWCFVAKEEGDVLFCSSPYERHSKSIGLILPIVPQTDRDAKLAYDIVKPRAVQFKNTNPSKSVTLSWSAGFEVCADKYAENCVSTSSTEIQSSGHVWLKVPSGAMHEVTVTIGALSFKAILKEFIDSRWHGVHV